MREVAGEFERPVLLFSGGKDSIVMLHLAEQGVLARAASRSRSCTSTPGTTSPRSSSTATARVAEHGLRLVVASVQDAIDDGRVVERPDGSRNPLQTVPLLDGITANKFDAVFGGGRRDEEKARAKERVFSMRDEFGQWDPRRQRPELWDLYNGRHAPGRARARLPAVQLDRAGRLALHRARADRAPGDLLRAPARGLPARRHVARRRAAGRRPARGRDRRGAHGPLPHGRRHDAAPAPSSPTAADVAEVIAEVGASRLTERGATRADDRASEAAMEDRKREGYF